MLGADWRDDPVMWDDRPTPQTWPSVTVSNTGRYVLVEAMVGWQRVDLHLLDRGADGTGSTWRTLIVGVDAINDGWSFAADDSVLVGTTTLDAPRGRVVRVDLGGDDLAPTAWHTLVPQGQAVLGRPQLAPGGFFLSSTLVGVDHVDFVIAARVASGLSV